MTHFPFDSASASAPAVRAMLEHACPKARDASLIVHPGDDMYAFGVHTIGFEPLAAMAYFRAGASMVALIDAVARWHFGALERVGSFLDFAAGYGRSTRLLVRLLPPSAIVVAEIQSEALDFQRWAFGVNTLQSAVDPLALAAAQSFDYVFVGSLFTHLPRRTFGLWLARLWELVAPGGVLVFSVHDRWLDTFGAEWQDGFAFIAASEVSSLDTEQYGTSFTTEQFVRAQLVATVGEHAKSAVRLPRALCFMQDVWVVVPGPSNPRPLLYENGPNGVLDSLEVAGRRYLLSGWAADAGLAQLGARSHAIVAVQAHFSDGSIASAELGQARADVARYFGRECDPAFEASGWTARGSARRRLRPDDIVTVVARCDHGQRFVLDSTRIADMLARDGRTVPPTPLQRRLATARWVYSRGGVRALLTLAPVVARNECRRLGGMLWGRLVGRRPGG